MKKIKSVLSLLLCFTLILSLCIPAFAVELTADGTSASTVAHTVNAEFAAEIPAYIVPTEQGQAYAGYTVTLDNAVIPDGQELTAKVEYSGTMREQNGVELPYELLDETGNTISSGEKILSKSAGTPTEAVSVSFGAALTAKAKYAGVYTDTATFTFDVAEKIYTLDEINADEHLFAIGQTKPEYVVARFNEDYSVMTVFANGESSDGKMLQILELNGTGYWEYMYYAGLTGYEIKAIPDLEEILNENYDFFLILSNIIDNDITINCTIQSGITDISKSFLYYCNLGTLVIPNTVKTIGSLTALNVKNLIISEGVEEISPLAFGTQSEHHTKGVGNVTIPRTVKRIDDWAFYGSPIKSAIIPEGVEYIGEGAFAHSGVTSVVVPGTVEKIKEHTFEECMYLTDITLNYGIKTIEANAFIVPRDNKTQTVDNLFIPSSVKKIGPNAFYGSKISDITLSEGLEEIGLQAFGYNNFKSIKVPSSVIVVGEKAFLHCENLETIVFGDNVTSLGKQALSDCYALNNVTLPKSITELQDYTFNECHSLISIVIPENIARFGTNVFYECDNLESITIPKNVTYLPFRKTSTYLQNLTTVYGETGSYAETWAAENGCTFVEQ